MKRETLSQVDTTATLPAQQPGRGTRLHGLDFTRGLACLSMPIYHSVHNLYIVGLVDKQWTKHWFWEIYQHLGLGTFVLVSGMAFTLSTRRGIRWPRILRRALKLVVVALLISLATYLIMQDRFVRFGVIHFFATTVLLAPLFKPARQWLLLPGLAIVALAVMTPGSGIYPTPWLYITGLMSSRPPSLDYIPLVPWFGVFLIGMALAHWLPKPAGKQPGGMMRAVIWLGKHSLSFYLIHQVLVYGLMWSLAYLLS